MAVRQPGTGIFRLLVSFDYWDPRELLTVFAVTAAALPVGLLLLSKRARPAIALVRSVATGSVNDSAGYLVVGLLASVTAVLAH